MGQAKNYHAWAALTSGNRTNLKKCLIFSSFWVPIFVIGRGHGPAQSKRIANGPSVTIELTKRLVRDLMHRDLNRQLQNEAWAIGIQTEDGRAFRERRQPEWKGR